jgi:oxygen-independent coproporphyrinogen-3 oxidase
VGCRLSAITLPGAATRAELTVLPPLALYIHLPWCVKKCPYCDFNSHALREGIPERRYVDALIADLDHELPNVWGRRVTSVFFGGGTPSLFSAIAIDEILAAVRARIALDPGAEITLEANPGTVEAEKFEGFARAGVNRLSLGIQSFNDAHLKALGRIHDSNEARRAIEIACATFENINLDLMFALPNQTIAECDKDIETALSFGAPHLSMYHLTLEPNTLFHRDPPPLPSDDLAADMHAKVIEWLGAAGYENYETSAHAKLGRSCRHNVNYWNFGDYLGIGAGAHGKVSFADRIVRNAKHKHPETYMQRSMVGEAAQETREVTTAEVPFEFMLNALRLSSGFPLVLFRERTGLGLESILPALNLAESRGLIERDHANVRPTEKGRLFLNDLLEMFLVEDGKL